MSEGSSPTHVSTRDRLVDEAMRLFGEQGYRATSVAQIEAAAGLTAGAGGLYHHFRSKEALLAAGIERHVARLDALRDIRRIFGSLTDLRSELTVTARYVLALLDEEAQLLRIALSELGNRPPALDDAFSQVLASSYEEFTEWLGQRAARLTEDEARALAATALNALLADRLTRRALDVVPYDLDDDALIEAWVEMVARRLG